MYERIWFQIKKVFTNVLVYLKMTYIKGSKIIRDLLMFPL